MKATPALGLPLYERPDDADLLLGYNNAMRILDTAVAECSTFRSGHGSPFMTGKDDEGDVYLDLDAKTLWAFVGSPDTCRLRWQRLADLNCAGGEGVPGPQGPEGPQGPAGPAGSRFIDGHGDPTAQAAEGDVYLDVDSLTLWRCHGPRPQGVAFDGTHVTVDGETVASVVADLSFRTHGDIGANEATMKSSGAVDAPFTPERDGTYVSVYDARWSSLYAPVDLFLQWCGDEGAKTEANHLGFVESDSTMRDTVWFHADAGRPVSTWRVDAIGTPRPSVTGWELTVSSLGVWTAEGYRALRSLGIAGVSDGAIVWDGDMWTRIATLGGSGSSGTTFDAGAGEPTVTGSTKPGDMWIDTNQGDLWKAEDR